MASPSKAERSIQTKNRTKKYLNVPLILTILARNQIVHTCKFFFYQKQRKFWFDPIQVCVMFIIARINSVGQVNFRVTRCRGATVVSRGKNCVGFCFSVHYSTNEVDTTPVISLACVSRRLVICNAFFAPVGSPLYRLCRYVPCSFGLK